MWVRIPKVKALGGLGLKQDQRVIDRLVELLGDKNRSVRAQAAEALDRLGLEKDPRVVDRLIELLGDNDGGVRAQATRVLDRLGLKQDSRVIDRRVELLGDTNYGVRQQAVEALGKLDVGSNSQVVEGLLKLLGNTNWNVRLNAAGALGKLGLEKNQRVVERYIVLLGDTDWSVRAEAAKALGKLGLKQDPRIDHVMQGLRAEAEAKRQRFKSMFDFMDFVTQHMSREIDPSDSIIDWGLGESQLIFRDTSGYFEPNQASLSPQVAQLTLQPSSDLFQTSKFNPRHRLVNRITAEATRIIESLVLGSKALRIHRWITLLNQPDEMLHGDAKCTLDAKYQANNMLYTPIYMQLLENKKSFVRYNILIVLIDAFEINDDFLIDVLKKHSNDRDLLIQKLIIQALSNIALDKLFQVKHIFFEKMRSSNKTLATLAAIGICKLKQHETVNPNRRFDVRVDEFANHFDGDLAEKARRLALAEHFPTIGADESANKSSRQYKYARESRQALFWHHHHDKLNYKPGWSKNSNSHRKKHR